MQVNWSLEKKRWGPRVSKIFQIDLAFLDVRLVIDVTINIFLVIYIPGVPIKTQHFLQSLK